MTTEEYNHCVTKCADDVLRFALRCGSRREVCEDAVQDAMLSLWSHHQGVSASSGKSYLLSAVYRRLMSHVRHSVVEQNYASDFQATTSAATPPDTAFDLRDAINLSLQSLPEVQRAILQLRDVDGYSYAEIGKILLLNDKQVQVYLFRARVAMRRELTRLGYGNNQ